MTIIKTLDEIKKIKKANEIIARFYEDIIPKYIKPGISTLELDKIAEDYIRSRRFHVALNEGITEWIAQKTVSVSGLLCPKTKTLFI